MFSKIGALKPLANFAGKNACVGVSFKEVSYPLACNFIKNRLQNFEENFSSQNTSGGCFFKVSNRNNLFKDSSAIPFTQNKSLIKCSSHNDKLI